jgi:hypothetical protein
MNEAVKISFSLAVILWFLGLLTIVEIFSLRLISVQNLRWHKKKESGLRVPQLPFHSHFLPVESTTNFNGVLDCLRYEHILQNKSNIARSPPFGASL